MMRGGIKGLEEMKNVPGVLRLSHQRRGIKGLEEMTNVLGGLRLSYQCRGDKGGLKR